jgi:hypothetical protein
MNDREEVLLQRQRGEGAPTPPPIEEQLEKRAVLITHFISLLEEQGLARNEAVLIAAYQFAF